MTSEWWDDIRMMVQWRNDSGMMEWHRNDVIMTEWPRKEGMTPEWWNEVRMTGMKSRNTTFPPEIWDDENDKNAIWMTEIVIPTSFLSFHQNVIPRHSKARMTLEWMEWHQNDGILSTWNVIDGMTLEWWNDIWMKEKLQNGQGMVEWHANDGIMSE